MSIGMPVAARRSRLALWIAHVVDGHVRVARDRRRVGDAGDELERVRLQPDHVDQVLALEDVDDLQVLVRRGGHAGDRDVVEHQLGVGEVLLGQAEPVEDPVVARAVGAVVAPERLHVVAAGGEVRARVLGRRPVRRIPGALVDDLQHVDVRVARRDGREPLLDLRQLLVGRERRHPRRLLVAPQQDVEVELDVVGLREVVGLVERGPAHRRGPRRPRRAAPLARVLGDELVEVARERRGREVVRVAEELVLGVQRERLRRRAGRDQRQARDRRERSRERSMDACHSRAPSTAPSSTT